MLNGIIQEGGQTGNTVKKGDRERALESRGDWGPEPLWENETLGDKGRGVDGWGRVCTSAVGKWGPSEALPRFILSTNPGRLVLFPPL